MSQQERKYLHIQSRTDTKEEWYNINPKLLDMKKILVSIRLAMVKPYGEIYHMLIILKMEKGNLACSN